MLSILRPVAGALVALALSASPGLAEQTYFVIKAADGSKPDFAVTDTVVGTLKSQSFETTLPGMDAAKHRVNGPLMRDLLSAAGITGEIADAVALDKYQTEIPVSDFHKYDVIVALELDGRKLRVRDKGPAWIVYPRSDVPELVDPIYEQRSVWQLSEVSVK